MQMIGLIGIAVGLLVAPAWLRAPTLPMCTGVERPPVGYLDRDAEVQQRPWATLDSLRPGLRIVWLVGQRELGIRFACRDPREE